MDESQECVEFDVELDKAHVEFLDKVAARLGCTRSDVLCQAVDAYLEQMGRRGDKENAQDEASRTGHTAGNPPTTD